MSIQGWFSLELTSLISLLSKGLSGVFCACVCSVAPVTCDSLQPYDSSPPGSSDHGILQARIWSWLPCPPQWYLPYPGFKSASPVSSCIAGGFFTTEPLEKLEVSSPAPQFESISSSVFDTIYLIVAKLLYFMLKYIEHLCMSRYP